MMFSSPSITPSQDVNLPSPSAPHPNVASAEPQQTGSPQADGGSGAETVLVTLLLSGGHECQLLLDPESPILKQLFALLLDPPASRAKRLLQLPLQSDLASGLSPTDQTQAAALCFTGDRLVGLITDPPIYVKQPKANTSDDAVSVLDPTGAQPTAHATAASSPMSTAQGLKEEGDRPMQRATPATPIYTVIASPSREQSLAAGTLPSRYIQLTNFLTTDTHQHLLDYALRQESAFVSSSTSTGDVDYRQSMVLHHFPEFANLMQREIHAAFADVTSALHIDLFNITQVEAQLTAHNDGNYYKIHNDNGSPDTATRVLTYVYYFYQEPKPFSGGELRIYDSRVENNFYVQADTFQDVTPLNNSIVFFPSYYMHEVLPISCPSRVFADSRFTLNGWVRR